MRKLKTGLLLIASGIWLFTLSGAASAQPDATLAVVKPAVDCAALASAPVSLAVGSPTTIEAKLLDTPEGRFCQVTGTIAPAIGFEVDLPTAKWTQRFIQAGCGGLCGMINASIGNAGTCGPALDGQFVVAASDLGHKGRMGAADEGAFAADPQKRIDFAYRANHLTALAAKALIRAYYGQPQRFSYFSGCSDGGREAMMEAERYPDDFDGISAGAPAMLFQVQNSFWHAWTVAANTDAQGRRILLAGKAEVLHAAVIAHCDGLDGVKDGLLSDPRACHVDPAWVLCRPGAADTSSCLTPAEWGAAAKLYAGPMDAEGHHFLPGGAEPGSELQWSFTPPTADGQTFGGRMVASMAQVVLADPSPAETKAVDYPFTTAQFARVNLLTPLNDATNVDLKPFAAHGGRLIMYHGWSDDSIAPMISVAYYEALRQFMGEEATAAFMRLYMIPGMGHCGGGDGFSQFDTLSPLMDWVETGRAPTTLMADKIPNRRHGPGGPPANGADGRSGPHPGGPGQGGPGPDGRGGFPGMRSAEPYAKPDEIALASRPIYPFPAIAHLKPGADPKLASSYYPAPSPAPPTEPIAWYGAYLLAPGGQDDYRVVDGRLVVASP